MVLPVREVRRATTRGRIVTLDLLGRPFPFVAGQAVELGTTDQPIESPTRSPAHRRKPCGRGSSNSWFGTTTTAA